MRNASSPISQKSPGMAGFLAAGYYVMSSRGGLLAYGAMFTGAAFGDMSGMEWR
jgi:hypothetical protein